MYESFFELKCKPFSLLPDPDFLFLSSRHSIALSLLEYSLTGQAGFCVITGEVGSGKTTLVRAFLGRVSRDFSVGLISNTHVHVRDIAGWALTAFGQKQSSTNPAEVYQELMAYLIAEYGAGRQCILIVDEAQNLSIEALEELRLLSNINSGKDLLLQILLVGQPELLDKLKRPELRQFAQRIAVSHHLSPLNFAESRQYIEHRLTVAGATKPVFNEMAIGAVQYFSGGVPRLINSICDLALVYAFADGVKEIDEGLVFRVITDRQLSGIAPFAHANPADDPKVREEISSIARQQEKPVADARKLVPKPVAQVAPAEAEEKVKRVIDPKMTAITSERAVPVIATLATPEPVTPEAVVAEPAQPIVMVPRRMPANVASVAVASAEPDERPTVADYYFDGEDADLLLTHEADGTEDEAELNGADGPREPMLSLNGAHSGQVVSLHAEPSDRLTLSGRNAAGKSESERAFPVIEGDRGQLQGGASLRVEETLLEAAPSGTAKLSERSWWRRAFRRGR